MEITNSSVITLDEITKQSLKPLDKSSRTTWICFALIVASSAFLIAMGDWIIGVCFLVIGTLFPIFNLVVRRVVKKKMAKANALMNKGIYYEYVFGDDDFKVSTVSGTYSSITNVKYDTLFKVQVFDDMIFFYVNQNSAYIVKNAGFKNNEDKDAVLQHIKSIQPSLIQ